MDAFVLTVAEVINAGDSPPSASAGAAVVLSTFVLTVVVFFVRHSSSPLLELQMPNPAAQELSTGGGVCGASSQKDSLINFLTTQHKYFYT